MSAQCSQKLFWHLALNCSWDKCLNNSFLTHVFIWVLCECASGRRRWFVLPVPRQQTKTKAQFFTQGTILPQDLLAEDSSERVPLATASEQPTVLSECLTGTAAMLFQPVYSPARPPTWKQWVIFTRAGWEKWPFEGHSCGNTVNNSQRQNKWVTFLAYLNTVYYKHCKLVSLTEKKKLGAKIHQWYTAYAYKYII